MPFRENKTSIGFSQTGQDMVAVHHQRLLEDYRRTKGQEVPTAETLEVVTLDTFSCNLSDGARVSWQTYMRCNCVVARKQHVNRNFCKHVVFVMKEGLDRLCMNQDLEVIVALGTQERSEPAWVTVNVTEYPKPRLYGMWNTASPVFLSFVDEDGISRIQARNIIVPHLIGMVNSGLILCKECAGVPNSIHSLMEDRNNAHKQMEAVREVAHFLSIPHGQDLLCTRHDVSDIIPF